MTKVLVLAERPADEVTHVFCCHQGEGLCGFEDITDHEDVTDKPFGADDEALCFACFSGWCRTCQLPSSLAGTP